MSVTKMICDKLAADTDLQAEVGTRIYGLYVPAYTSYPYITVVRQSWTAEDDLNRANPTNLRHADYEITVWATNTVDAERIEELILSAAQFGRYHVSTTIVQSQTFEGAADRVVPPADGSQEAVNAVDLAFMYDYLVNQPEPYVPILDTYTADMAYSVRKLSSSYTGPIIRIRRESDNAETDIELNGLWLDESAIAAHCGASVGAITTWYDQSGNGVDLTQTSTTKQPLIYDGSAVYKTNGKPRAHFINATGHYMEHTTPTTQPMQMHQVITFDSFTGWSEQVAISNRASVAAYVTATATSIKQRFSTSRAYSFTVTEGQQYLMQNVVNGANSYVRLNGSDAADQYPGDNGFTTGLRLGYDAGNSNRLNGGIQEIIIRATSDESGNLPIETDINTSFGVY